MKYLSLFVILLFCLGGSYLTSSADKDDYLYIRDDAKASPEASQKVKDFLTAHPAPSRYELIQLRSEVRPLVDKAAFKTITQ